ncbi:Opioid growth factor receptor (OGFr) conserved region [Lachnospiraceae bacterium KHCPX20]|nr:Opioid growth factor receptor (OGFr) conserved region [Lachnospiraceae bacterium KHCPX20]
MRLGLKGISMLQNIRKRIKHEHDVYAFLSSTGTDYKGRTYTEIINQDDVWLERTHDYIQCIFPTDEPSAYVPSPIVSIDEAKNMAANPAVINSLRDGLRRMHKFYEKNDHWLTPENHNYKRISRILRCLTIFGLREDVQEFFEFAKIRLLSVPDEKIAKGKVGTISIGAAKKQLTIEYWKEKMRGV